MGKSVIFGIAANQLHVGPSLTVQKSSEGMVTASLTFSCRKFDQVKFAIQSKLVRGSSLLGIYPEAGPDFAFLQVDDWDSADRPGGITEVTVRFKGASWSAEFSDESEVTYSRSTSLKEDSIFKHPTFLEQVTGQTRETIRLGSEGLAYKATSGYEIRFTGNGALIETLTDENFRFWWDWIVEKKNTTYDFPVSEWTKSATGKGKLRESDLANMGKIDTPPGNPSAPTGQTWRLTAATESLTISGDSLNSFSLTWSSGDWEERVYSAA